MKKLGDIIAASGTKDPCQSLPWILESHQYQGSFPTMFLNLHFLTFALIPLSDIRHSRLCVSPLLDDNLYLPTCCSNSWRFGFLSSTFYLCVTGRHSRDCQLWNKICTNLTGENKNIYFHVSPIRTVSLFHLLEKIICILILLNNS